MSMVSLVKVRGQQFEKAILDSLRLINYEFPANVEKIVIKPNMCYYWDASTGHTTDPRFVASLIRVLRHQISQDVHISIIESDASAMKCKYAFKILGYKDLAREHNVSLVNLSLERSKKVTVDVGNHQLTFRVPQIIENADLRINVPKIKYHSLKGVKITCALKNIFGCNPYPRKFKYHSEIDKVIVALNKIMPFDLCIVDGNIVAGGQTQRLGLVMTSTDPVALDSLAARIMGINPRSIQCLKLASREGLGKTEVACRGTDWKYFKARYPRRSIRKKIMNVAFKIVTRLNLESRLGLD